MINGAIDAVSRSADGNVLLSGWARHVSSDAGRPVDGFTLVGGDDAAISVTERDIAGTPGCGFKLLLSSAEELAALRWGGLSLRAWAGDEVRVLAFWDRLKETVSEIIMVHLAESLYGKAEAAARLHSVQQAKRDRDAIRSYLDAVAGTSACENVLVKPGATSHDFKSL